MTVIKKMKKNDIKILLINPCLRYETLVKHIPVGLACIATALDRAGFAVDILDIDLPSMNAFAVLKRIREIDPQARVIMLAAKPILDLIRKALVHGAQHCLTFPFQLKSMYQVFRRVLSIPA